MVWFHPGAFSSGTSNELEADGARLAGRGDVVVVTVNHRLNVFGHLYLAGARRRRVRRLGQRRPARSRPGAAVGARPHRRVRRRPGQRDRLRPVRRRREDRHADGDAAGARAVPPGHHDERPADHRQPGGHRRTAHRAASRRAGPAPGARPGAARAADGAPDRGEPGARLPGAGHRWPGAAARSVRSRCAAALRRHPDDPRQHRRRDPHPHRPRPPGAVRSHLGDAAARAAGELAVHGHRSTAPRSSASIGPGIRTTPPPMSSSRRRPPRARGAGRSSRRSGGRCSRWPSAHTWVFQFDWRTPVDGGRWGAHHGLDVPFSFDNAAIVPDKVGTGADALALSRQMSDAWLAFARTGRPATPSLPEWPVYDLAARRDDDLRPRGARGVAIRAATSAVFSRRYRMCSPERSCAGGRRPHPRPVGVDGVAVGAERAAGARRRSLPRARDDEARHHVHGRDGERPGRLRLVVPARPVAALGRDGSPRRR